MFDYLYELMNYNTKRDNSIDDCDYEPIMKMRLLLLCDEVKIFAYFYIEINRNSSTHTSNQT
jgi:hypothetical protein